DTPVSLPKIRAADVHLHYTGAQILGRSMPLDNIVAQLDIVDGRIAVHPLTFQVGKGSIALDLAADAQQDLVHAAGDVDFRQVDLAHLMQKMTVFKGAGTIGGKARFESTGNSVASLLGHGNGEMQLFTAGGDLSALLVDLAGLDFGGALMSAIGLPSKAALRCAIADYSLDKGVLNTRLLLLDTTEANITGSGKVNLDQETVDYQLKTEPKHLSVLILKGPIDISGTLRNPKIRPDAAGIAKRAVPAAILGVLLTPLAALLPTITLGLGEDNNCTRLVHEAQAQAAQTGAQGKAAVQKNAGDAAKKPVTAAPK
ncbi:MAG TPA: AsmA-like C-terminal region-containing protein, partial [Nevskiaceae bacterium]|nr:AsmA-like C-terminal region-containing protein [Nevskiaceae bacterium]